MDESFYQPYLQRSIPEYANAHIKAGNWKSSEALQKSEEEFKKLLPNGVETDGQYLLQIEDDESDICVGAIWFAEVKNDENRVAFLYEIYIDEHYRSRSYGEQAMWALETKARKLGFNSIFLHVFADNHIARSLYRKLGYEVVKTFYDRDDAKEMSFRMVKELEELR